MEVSDRGTVTVRIGTLKDASTVRVGRAAIQIYKQHAAVSKEEAEQNSVPAHQVNHDAPSATQRDTTAKPPAGAFARSEYVER